MKEMYCLFMDVSSRTRTSRKNCSVMGVHYLVKQHSFLDRSRKTLTVKMFDRGVIAFLVCGAARTLFNQVETVGRISRYSRVFYQPRSGRSSVEVGGCFFSEEDVCQKKVIHCFFAFWFTVASLLVLFLGILIFTIIFSH